ncbi:protein translocase subunit SecF [Candidatus Marinamargulisbacteria bacterium SCGC AG-333-B06]|nr:protein translocase subunit SecF [Candidatus Marinamargulisbacteria bacterium SCGC AG-333-B06]
MKTEFKFVEKKNFWLMISATIILIGLSLMTIRFFQNNPILNYGIDFLGGNTFHLKLNTLENTNNSITQLTAIRSALSNYNLENSQIQFSNNNEVYIKTIAIEKNKTTEILNSIRESVGDIEVLEIDFIGPSIGKSLQKQALLIIVFVTAALLLYITLRFQLSFGLAAILALLHDGLIIFSMTSILKLEINIAFIAALLTILGYSINDTIVIFDRIREKVENFVSGNINELTNISLNQTLQRTFNTSITTLMVILSLILFGGKTIQEFCIILAIGIVSGTYSSLCIASPILAKLYKPPPS